MAGVKVGVGTGLIPQGKAIAMGQKGQNPAPASGGGLAKTMKAPAQMMKKIAAPAAPKPMKGMGTKGLGKLK